MRREVYRTLFALAVCFGCAARAEPVDAATVIELPAFHLNEALSSVVVRIYHQKVPDGQEPRLSAMIVHEVRPGSWAARAGLRKGMAIIAIESVILSGLLQSEFDALIVRPMPEGFTLRVESRWSRRIFDLRVPADRGPVHQP